MDSETKGKSGIDGNKILLFHSFCLRGNFLEVSKFDFVVSINYVVTITVFDIDCRVLVYRKRAFYLLGPEKGHVFLAFTK